jgi:hypothetical protein
MAGAVPRPIGALARKRVLASDNARRFRTYMARALAALDNGEDLTTAPRPTDPVEAAAQIEALASVRRLTTPGGTRSDDH